MHFFEREEQKRIAAEREKERAIARTKEIKQEIKDRVRIEEEERDRVWMTIQRKRFQEQEFAMFQANWSQPKRIHY